MGKSYFSFLAALLGLTLVANAQPPTQLPPPASGRDGYRLEPDRIQVETMDHWRLWESADGVRHIEADGTVRPRFIRRAINAALNATEFTNIFGDETIGGGISAVGARSSELTAPLIIDGDPSTYWEPDLSEDLENLWIEIDLGRAVIATRIVVRFVEEDQGDPFLKFRVLTSDGFEDFGRNRVRKFSRAGQVSTPNKTQRIFDFPLDQQRSSPEGVVGKVIQFVRIDLLDTDTDHGTLIDQSDYERLAPQDQGAIDYFRRTSGGREIAVIQETYDQLPPQEQGPVRHYQRERPRLADIEVYTLGDNVVTLTQRALFEEGKFFDDIAKRFVTDGLYSTRFGIRVYDFFRDKDQITVDLGAKFWLDRIRLLSNETPLTSYQLRVSDGSLDATGQFLWANFPERLNAEAFLQIEEAFPPREVRLIELRRLDLLQTNRPGLLNEIQAYGEGYVSELDMTSPLIKLDQRQMVSQVQWEGQIPPGTGLEIRTRSGDELIEIPHYFKSDGRETSEALYQRLPDSQRGPLVIEEIPGADWSTWSELYDFSGESFKSPNPRRNILVQVRLKSNEPLRFASIRRLSLTLTPPLVDQAIGEIGPLRRVEPGVDRDFTLYLRSLPRRQDPGFDHIVLASSSTATIELLGLRVGTDLQLRTDTADQLWPGPVQFRPLEDGRLRIDLPEVMGQTNQLIELSLRTGLFLTSTTFKIELGHQDFPDRFQVVDAGDASTNLNSSALVVVSDLDQVSSLGTLEVTPPVFTPNADGVNDQITLEVVVFRLEGKSQIGLSIRDLAGQKRRDLSLTPERPSGVHQILWDGRDDLGRLLEPGIYLVHLDLAIEDRTKNSQTFKPVHLVY